MAKKKKPPQAPQSGMNTEKFVQSFLDLPPARQEAILVGLLESLQSRRREDALYLVSCLQDDPRSMAILKEKSKGLTELSEWEVQSMTASVRASQLPKSKARRRF